MGILRVTDGPSQLTYALWAIGESLIKEAGEPTPVYNLTGALYLSSTGYLLLAVPNALVRGIFAAMHEPGVELPPGPNGEPFAAHITVMAKSEVDMIGADMISERGKRYTYTLGRLMMVEPDNWPGVARVYYVTVFSPELQTLRRSYGLSGLPHDGEYAFHVTCGIVKKGILGRNTRSKAEMQNNSAA